MFAQRNKMFYMEVSAKTGHNVEQAFYKMAKEVHTTTVRQSSESSVSRDKNGRGRSKDSQEGENGENMMADRVKLTRPSGSRQGN